MWEKLRAIAERLSAYLLAVAMLTACSQEDELSSLQASAEAGDSMAQYNLAWHYLDGDEVPRNEAIAEQWFERSAAQGVGMSKYELGRLHKQRLTEAEQRAALKWFEAAHADGISDARDELAAMLASSPNPSLHDGPRAVALIESEIHDAARASPTQFETLAAAYARAGRFAEAIGAQRHALERLGCDCKKKADVSIPTLKLAAYERGEAWVDNAP